jgi:hypothetical protein
VQIRKTILNAGGADWAEKAIEQRDPLMIFILRLPLAKALRSSSRWRGLAKMMNVPETAQ